MSNPYRVLGLSPDATDDEIKEAYRTLAKKYHPDNYAGNPLSDLAEEKMKQLNEAYDQIQAERAARANANGGAAGQNAGSARFAHIRASMQSGNYADAEVELDAVPQSERNAEWNFLKGSILLQRGWYTDAQKYLETACYMDPHNSEYRATLNRVTQAANGYGRAYRAQGGSNSDDLCNCCTNLICLDCLCECMGGDLITCC